MGHIGYSTSIYFAKKNLNLIGIYNQTINKKYLNKLKKNKIKLIKSNLLNKKLLSRIIYKHKIKTCIFCSGVTHDSVAKVNPEKAVNSNIIGLLNLLEMQKAKKLKKIIYLSTGSVFQEIKSSVKISEYVTPTPKSVYAGTKRMGEILVENFRNEFKVNCCVIRVSWVYGPPIEIKKFNPQRGPIPFIFNKIINNKKNIIKFNGGDFKASFTYIDDVCDFIYRVLNKKVFDLNIYQLGSGKNNSNHEVAKILSNLFNKNIIFNKGVKPWSNDSVMRGPIYQYKNSLKFKNKFSLSKGLSSYYKWLIKK